jgi:hypothetical protein
MPIGGNILSTAMGIEAGKPGDVPAIDGIGESGRPSLIHKFMELLFVCHAAVIGGW